MVRNLRYFFFSHQLIATWLRVWHRQPKNQMLRFHPEFEDDVFGNLEPFNVVKSRTSEGGTGFSQVEKEVNNWQKKLLL